MVLLVKMFKCEIKHIKQYETKALEKKVDLTTLIFSIFLSGASP